ncbi:uncharacterized protein LOC143347725 [Colletes latitarsis]|uniref:uncharacterized protein LOC143347725 n=1 Tax=Colletes latitarsis TaxID=2605962 RepID=UPI0040359134
MQPGVTVVLATVWLVVYADVVGTANLYPSRLTFDQYSPLAPHRHGVYRKVEGQLDWKDQNPAENQPLDLSIGPRRSISANTESPDHPFGVKYLEKDLIFPRMGNSAVDDFSPLFEDKQFHNYDGRKFADEKVDGGGPKTPKLLSRELPPSELEDPFVADDTFQDQGPGSVEIYKLDLLREKPLLSPTPATRLLTKSKSKTPKKSGHVNWKVKTTEYRTTSPKMIHKQSNTFDDSSTELPPNSDPFSIGGVPELQVGCEGLEAFNHKQKRSIDPPTNEKNSETGVDLWAEATPISLNVDYELSEEEGYEEMDELLKLRKLETTTKRTKHNRGDMEATLHLDFFEEKRRAEKLPVRGDLGKVKVTNESATLPATVPDNQRVEKGENKGLHFSKAKRSVRGGSTANQSRKILWVDDSKLENRSKPGAWGFGEDEGVVTSDELQTENQRRRKQEDRRREEEARRRSRIENRTDYERELERRRMEEEKRRRYESRYASPDEEERKRQRQLEENRLKELERRRMREEERSRWEEAARRRQEQQELVRRNLEAKRREWMLKRNREEEERRRNESPPSSLYAMRASSNESRPYDPETERRMREQQHRDREQKVREYVQRNRPINVNGSVDRRKEEGKKKLEEERRRLEEERKLQEYIRRNQPIHVHRANESNARYLLEHRRTMDSAGLNNRPRYPMPEIGRRNHGPSAPTYYPQSYPNRELEEQRIREMERQEELRREAARREKETRRIQSRRYEEQRRRQEAAKLEADRRIKELVEMQSRRSQAGRTRPTENTRPVYENRRRFEEQRRRQDASLIPVNLRLNESRRTMELERQRQEQQRRRIEAERRRQEESRTKEARENEERTRAMKEEWKRRQEEARLNALPVSARIIIQPGASSSPPVVLSRAGVNNDIDFSGINPNRQGLQVSNFPAPSTRWPPVRSPPLCVWAVVHCCPYNANRLVTCFESAGCPGVNWDPNPCKASIMRAATEQITKFYAEIEENRHL